MGKSRFRKAIAGMALFGLAAGLVPAPAAFAADSSAPPAVRNAGFEEPRFGPAVPGWTQTFGVGESGMSFGVTSAQAYEGTSSLLLDDANGAKALGLESDPFPVVPGASYSVSAMMKVENGSMAIYIRFFDAAGVKVGESSSFITQTNGGWTKNATSTVVPANAATGTVLLYSSAAGITRGYADRVGIELNRIGTFEHIGGVVKGTINEDSAIGIEDGKPVMYTVFKGRGEVPTVFAVIDAASRGVLRTYPMPGVEAAWGVKVASDGQVYVGTHYDGGLYRYAPNGKTFGYIGRFGAETHVFSLVAGPAGKMYAGTYPGGKLFEYDPADGTIRDLGSFDPEQKYVRSLAYDARRDVLYVGVGGTKSRIYRLNPDGSRTELLAGSIPGGGDAYAWPYGMEFAEDRLFVKFSNGDLLVMRGDDNAVEYFDPAGLDIHSERVTAIPGQPGKVLYSNSGHLYAYDVQTRTSTQLKTLAGGVNFHEGKFVDLGSPDWPGLTFVAGGKFGNVIHYNMTTGRAEVKLSGYEGAPTLIQSIHQGPEGSMYVAGYMAGFTSYDPVTGAVSETEDLGQIESSAVRGGKMLIGAYAGARILEYDPSQPWSGSNPRQLFDLRAYGQDRPFAMAYAEDKDLLFVGTVPNSTSLQGALAVYDFASRKLDVFRNIVPNQSVVSMAYKDGLLYVGTTVYGGLGTSGPAETNAKLFVFDPATKRKLFETVPATGRKGVTGLAVGPDGLIWGVAEDTIFKFDPATRQFTYKAAKLRRYKDGTVWTYAFLQTGADGNVYGTSRGQFFTIKPDTMEFVLLNSSFGNYLNRDRFGNLYFSDNNSDLWKYTPPAEEAPDTAAPVTTAELSPQAPNGANGWYASPVALRLEAADDTSGVSGSVYSTDGGAVWRTYGGPVVFDVDGAYDVLYRSADRAGNTEEAKSVSFRIDRTPPAVGLNVRPHSAYLDSERIGLNVSVADALSGVDRSRTAVTLDGQPIAADASVDLAALPLGPHVFQATAADMAGNVASVTVPFRIETNGPSVLALIDRFAADGSIAVGGIANSLRSQLLGGELQAMLNHLEAQRGKHISAAAADLLIRDVRALLQPK
ncbi:OmpL47-type beta-barrel domain-containing protein [Paenibacillus sp. GYB003]|uniref:OmpL47-type beta-barrel domain-containing protein n=1 Tax=Paenibacillus sp. GYB003 TaxID=2994392 RepID=UPI002F9621DF